MPPNDKVNCIFCDGTGKLAFSEETRKLAQRAVEAQRNDTRTMDEKIRDGVSFILGPDAPGSAERARVDLTDERNIFERDAAPSSDRRSIADCVPDNWLDPLLTGQKAVLKGSGPWGCQDIEALLRALRSRIREAEAGR